jgi:uncharacterized protein
MERINDPAIYQCRTCEAPLPEGIKSPFFPFCSNRCRMVDLNRWFSGDFKISEPLSMELDEDQLDPEAGPDPE